MEINLENNQSYIVIAAILIGVLIIVYTETTTLGLLIAIIIIITTIAIIKILMNMGIIPDMKRLETQYKNRQLIRKIREPRLKAINPGEPQKKKEKWNIHW